MDFHRLARRELQTLCKKNKIPANMTNVAMADALKALEIVEGIEEFLQPCQSETAQSSIESSARSEVTSPYVPPTGGRSTRRRNVLKEEPETAKPTTRSRRMTRMTVVKDPDASQVDATETPAAMARTTRKKASMASACRKMDSQLKECVEEEKKDATMTPAPLGVTSRRRAVKEESAFKRVYSTRRSVRLAEKSAGLLKEVENENPGPLKKDLFAQDHENVEMNLTGNSDDLDGVSGITGVDENTNVEENSEKKDEVEVVSAQKQDVSLVSEGETVSTGEDEIGHHFEADGSKPEMKDGRDVEIQEVGFGCGTVAEFDERNCDKSENPKDENVVLPLNVHDEVRASDGSHDVHTSVIEITVENKEELDTDKDAEEYEFKAAEQKEVTDVVSPQKQDISIVSEGRMVSTAEEETGNHFEADSSKPEAKEGNDMDIQEVVFGFETNAELDGQKCDITEDPKIENIVMPKSNEVEESNGSHDDHTPEIGITVENKAELNTNKDAEYEGKAADISKPEAK
ncbi:hypothetical protein CDL12_23837 [Handroanthus impetiginosus]|uniref:Uncharacterized protein n=1 Tax=Handroanthus impetiginosus TaxID=429701 RepID=A0A2G9GED4_9LAMI|nr:hypothetical protein CDL12_23837 [Handroanthus impetiginosus]